MLDRTKQPDFKEITKLVYPKAEQKKLDNKIPVYLIDAGTEDILKVEFIFEAGVWYQKKPLSSSLTNSLLSSGSKNLTEQQIAEKIDFYGAYISLQSDRDYATITLFTLNKYLKETIAIIKEIIANPMFPEKEFETEINIKKNQFVLDLTKVKTIASRKFISSIFGEQHPYGTLAVANDFDNIKTSDLKDFYQKYYTIDNCKIIVAGKLSKDTFTILNDKFGDDWSAKSFQSDNDFRINASNNKEQIILKEDVVQSALRIGCNMFSRKHPDYAGMQVLNTVLGGYFGSRLMKNIREDKAYTYGIGSVVYPMKHEGYFSIISEVNANVCRNAVDEIYKELSILSSEKISEQELILVKNYIKGDLLKGFDGPFNLSEKYKIIITNDLDETYFAKFMNLINTISSDDLMKLSQKYLDNKNLISIIAGKC